jgi:phosphoglycolate phosphatase
VFDLDGTLIDSYRAIADSLNHARSAFGLPVLEAAAVRARVGRGLESLIAELIGPEHVAEGVSLFRERYAVVHARSTVALPGVLETLRGLDGGGYAMAVASNKPARFSAPILERLGLLPYIRCVLGPDVVDSHKPEPRMIERCLEILNVSPHEAVYVGDMALDVESAARAAVPVLLVPGGSSSTSALLGTGQRVLGAFTDLARLFPRAPGVR